MSLVFSCFPGTGKTWVYQNQEQLGVSVLDSDSSVFSWLSEGVRNPDFPSNYITHIKENLGKFDVILVSCHTAVRDALYADGISFRSVVPAKSEKENYLNRYRQRGSPASFVCLLCKNWDDWLRSMVIWCMDRGTGYTCIGADFLGDWFKDGKVLL